MKSRSEKPGLFFFVELSSTDWYAFMGFARLDVSQSPFLYLFSVELSSTGKIRVCAMIQIITENQGT